MATRARFVFVHGSPGDSGTWAGLRALAPEGATTDAWDLLDHGSSDAPDARLDDTIEDIAARVRTLGAPVTLVGHSFGAWVAAHVAAALGERVTRLVAMAGLAGSTPSEAAAMGELADAIGHGAIDAATLTAIAIERWLPREGRDSAHERAIADLLTREGSARLARVLRRSAALAEPARRAGPFGAPCTVIHCAGDRAVPIERGLELAALSSCAEVITLPGDSHFPHWTSSAEVASLVFGRDRVRAPAA